MDRFSVPFSLPGAGPGEGPGSEIPIGTGIFCGFAPEPIPTQVNYNMGDEWNYPDSPRSVYSQEHQDPDDFSVHSEERGSVYDRTEYDLEKKMDGW